MRASCDREEACRCPRCNSYKTGFVKGYYAGLVYNDSGKLMKKEQLKQVMSGQAKAKMLLDCYNLLLDCVGPEPHKG